MMDTHRKHAPKGRAFCCVSSARTVQEASDSEVDWEQSTACLYCDVVSQNRLPSKQAQGMKWSEVGAVGGVCGV